MNDNTEVYIRGMTAFIRKLCHLTVPVSDIDDVVRQLGGTIIEKPGLDRLYDGTVRKMGDLSFEIAVFPRQEKPQRTFAIARELGHLFLHMGYPDQDGTWQKYEDNGPFQNFSSDEQEAQAYMFAASLLMPEREFLVKVMEYSDDDGMVNIEKVAEYFGIYPQTVVSYGRYIGLFPQRHPFGH